MAHRGDIKSVKKACAALVVINQQGDVTVTDIARALGIVRPTAYRVLETLATLGYVEKQPHSDFYRLTSRVTQLSSGFQRENRALEVAKPMIHEIGKRIGWSVSLLTPRGADMVIRITTNHDSPLALERYRVGLAVPVLHSTAGLCHLAHCESAERERILGMAQSSGDPLQRLARNRARLDAILSRVRGRGFSNLEFLAYREGNIGVPLTLEGKCTGGLVMRYIKSAMTPEKLLQTFIPQMQELARNIDDDSALLAPATSLDPEAGTRRGKSLDRRPSIAHRATRSVPGRAALVPSDDAFQVAVA